MSRARLWIGTDVGRFSKLETNTSQHDQPPEDWPPAVKRPEEPASPMALPEEPAYDAPGLMARGDEAFFTGEVKEAVRWYSRAMESDSRCLEAWVAHVQILILTDQINEAKVWVGRALSIFANAPALLALRAVVHAKTGMVRQAMATSDMILDQKAEDVTAWMARGHVLLIADNKNSGFCFDQAMRLSLDREWKVPFIIGLIHESERQWARAIAFYEKALERRSTLPYAWYRMGECQRELGRPDAARKALLRARELAVDNESLIAKIDLAKSGSFMNVFRKFFKSK